MGFENFLRRGDLFRLPLLAAQLPGMFPLTLIKDAKRQRFRVIFSWTGAGTILLLLRWCIIISATIYHWNPQEVEAALSGWTKMASFSELFQNSFVTFADMIWALMVFLKRREINWFFISVVASIVEGWLGSRDEEEKIEIKEMILRKYRKLRFIVTVVISLSCVTVATNCLDLVTLFRGHPEKRSVASAIMWVLDGLFGTHLRLLSFYLPAAFMFAFQIAYATLKAKILKLAKKQEMRITDGVDNVMQNDLEDQIRISQILAFYDKMDKLLKEFHVIFNFQLTIGMLSMMFTILDAMFKVVIIVMDLVKGSGGFNAYQLVTFMPLLISLLITVYVLCNAATAMTREAKDCVFAFRRCPDLDSLPVEVKESILMFFVQRVTNPPKVSPFNLYTLGRHLFPTVRLLLKTDK